MSHPNADILRRAYAVRDRAEVEPVRQWLHEDVVWHLESGDLRGPQAVLAILAEADRTVGRTQSHEIHAILADDDYGIVLNTVRATRDEVGRSYEDLHVHVTGSGTASRSHMRITKVHRNTATGPSGRSTSPFERQSLVCRGYCPAGTWSAH